MKKELFALIETGKAQKKLNQSTLNKAKKIQRKKLDALFEEEHYTVFEEMDCLDCANCCKTTSPLFRDKDIERLSAFFKLKTVDFIDKYLWVDEDGDYVLKSSPCAFLQGDNTCSVYSVRPLACKEYPHTDRKGVHGILNLNMKNAEICPAVVKILQNLRVKI